MKNYKKIINDNSFITTELDITSKYKFFQEINVEAKLHIRKTRVIQNANLEKPEFTIYHYGQYKYFDNNKQKYCYITEKLPDVTGKRRYDDATIIRAVKPVIKDEMTIHYASRYAKENYHLKSVASTIWNWAGIIEITEESKQQIEKETRANCSGHLGIDEVYDKKDGIIFATDLAKDLILSTKICEGKPNNNDIETVLQHVKNKGIIPKTCAKDGSPLYLNTITKVFIHILLQTCIFHLIKNLIKYFLDWHKCIRIELNIKALPRGLKCSGRHLKQYLFRKRTLFVKRELTDKERVDLKNIMDGLPELRILRRKYLQFISIFDAEKKDAAIKKYWLFISDPIVNERMPDLIKQLKKHFDQNELFTYLEFDRNLRTKIRTTNQTERTNRKFRKKQKTHYRIRNNERRKRMITFMYFFHNHKSLKLDFEINLIVANGKILFVIFSDYKFFSFYVNFKELIYTNENTKNKHLIKYILSYVDCNQRNGVIIDYRNMTIEHLVSQENINSSNENIIGQIGNLILIDPRTNAEKLKGKAFKEKKKILKECNYPFDSILESNDNLTNTLIEERTKEIARKGYDEIWKI